MISKETCLLVDGLNLCFKNHQNFKQMISDIKKAMKIFRKFMNYKVENIILVYGLLPPNNTLEKNYNELKSTISRKKQEYEATPFYNFMKRKSLEEELKVLQNKLNELKQNTLCKSGKFWNEFIHKLRDNLAKEGYIVNKITPIPINLYRKHSDFSKIEKEDDIVLAVFTGLLATTSNKFMIFTDDRRLIEVTFKALKYYDILSRNIGAIVRSESVGNSLEKEFEKEATIVVLNKVIPPSIETNSPW